MRSDKKLAILLITAFLFASCALHCGPAAGSSGASYDVYVKTSGGWALQEELQFSKYYETASVDLSAVLPDVDGEYKVRIAQHGGIAAHIDYIALSSPDGTPIPPTSATCINDGSDVLLKVLYQDNDVADAWEKSIEVTWSGGISSPVLLFTANEEAYSTGAPLLTPRPMIPELMMPYTIQNNGVIVVDGVPDALGEADFSDYWMPASGHPNGFAYLWLRSDGEYLYGTMEVTADNTYDETGWGALYIYANGALKQFKVDAASHEYGIDGFVYTDKVVWQHMVYEFEIPLSELGATIGDTIKLGYGSYGTMEGYDQPPPEVNWNYTTNKDVTDIALGALDGNPGVDVAAIDHPGVGTVYAISGLGPGTWNWTNGSIRGYAIGVGDINKNVQGNEVIAGGFNLSVGRGLTAYDKDGNFLWFYPTGTDITDIEIGDIDGVDGDDVVACDPGGGDQTVYAVNGTGANLTGWPVSDPAVDVAVGQLDGEDGMDVAAINQGDQGGGLHIYNSTGGLIWSNSTYAGQTVEIGDVNGDGKNDAVFGLNNGWILIVTNFTSPPEV